MKNVAITPKLSQVGDLFKVREWRPFEKNTLRGFLSLELPSGLIVHGISLHAKGDAKWVSLPAKEYSKGSERAWSPIVEFANRDCRESFQQFALQAIDAYLREGGE